MRWRLKVRQTAIAYKQNGVRAREALRQSVAGVRGHAVYAADPEFDSYWLDQLARAAGAASPFVVGDAGKFFERTAAERSLSPAEARAEAERRHPDQHRAEADAKLLAEILHDGNRAARTG